MWTICSHIRLWIKNLIPPIPLVFQINHFSWNVSDFYCQNIEALLLSWYCYAMTHWSSILDCLKKSSKTIHFLRIVFSSVPIIIKTLSCSRVANQSSTNCRHLIGIPLLSCKENKLSIALGCCCKEPTPIYCLDYWTLWKSGSKLAPSKWTPHPSLSHHYHIDNRNRRIPKAEEEWALSSISSVVSE